MSHTVARDRNFRGTVIIWGKMAQVGHLPPCRPRVAPRRPASRVLSEAGSTDDSVGAVPNATGLGWIGTLNFHRCAAPAAAKVPQPLLQPEHLPCLARCTQHCEHHSLPRSRAPGRPDSNSSPPLPPPPFTPESSDHASALSTGPDFSGRASHVVLPPPRTSSSVMAMSDDLRRRGEPDDSFVPYIASQVTSHPRPPLHTPHTLSALRRIAPLRPSGPGRAPWSFERILTRSCSPR